MDLDFELQSYKLFPFRQNIFLKIYKKNPEYNRFASVINIYKRVFVFEKYCNFAIDLSV